jgi:hypothetical protein
MVHSGSQTTRRAAIVGAALLFSASAIAGALAAEPVTLHAIFLPATWGTVV